MCATTIFSATRLYESTFLENCNYHNFFLCESILTMNTIFQRTSRALEFGFSNVLQIISGNAISRHMSFTRGFYLEMEIRTTFLYEKHFQ